MFYNNFEVFFFLFVKVRRKERSFENFALGMCERSLTPAHPTTKVHVQSEKACWTSIRKVSVWEAAQVMFWCC